MTEQLRRPGPYTPLSVTFATGRTGSAILERFGAAGLGVWAAMLAAAKAEEGLIVFRHEDDWSAIGLTVGAPEWPLKTFLTFLGQRKQTRTTRQGRVMYVELTRWEDWTKKRERAESAWRMSRKRKESKRNSDRTPSELQTNENERSPARAPEELELDREEEPLAPKRGSLDDGRRTTRERALRVECPACGARPGGACLGKRTPPQERESCHAERHALAIDQGAPEIRPGEGKPRHTGCRMTRGSHGQGYVHDPLGTDKPPADWPHPPPTAEEVRAALVATNGQELVRIDPQRFVELDGWRLKPEELEQVLDLHVPDEDERIRLADLAADLRREAVT